MGATMEEVTPGAIQEDLEVITVAWEVITVEDLDAQGLAVIHLIPREELEVIRELELVDTLEGKARTDLRNSDNLVELGPSVDQESVVRSGEDLSVSLAPSLTRQSKPTRKSRKNPSKIDCCTTPTRVYPLVI
uniref:(northern house mosquito) hypothetical protein n=1 Tax=Culex pipiens TaxID=7175 RepID=A0A8D8ACM9_CULPI